MSQHHNSPLAAALQIAEIAEQIRLPEETAEVRELVADLQLKSMRLAKILARRFAGNVREIGEPGGS